MLTGRAKRLAEKLGNFEAAIIQTPVSRFYLLDFDSHDAGTLLLFPDEMVFIIDSRYIEVANAGVTNAQVMLETNAMAQTAELLQKRGVQKLLAENGITVAEYAKLAKAMEGIEVDASPTLGQALLDLRAIKSEDEIARIKSAQAITDACFTHILPFIKEGVSEIDLMLEMETYMRSHGAEKLAFDTICVAGPNSSRPHGVPSNNTVKPGDFITLDFGAKVDGYCSDMTRTVALGEPTQTQRDVYALVLKAHLESMAAVKAGVIGKDIDKIARDIIYGAGYEGRFGHGLGHSLGIDVHEDPRFSPVCSSEIKAGMLMTIEPGVYLPGEFGVRIEDTIIVKEDGFESIAHSDKQLIIL